MDVSNEGDKNTYSRNNAESMFVVIFRSPGLNSNSDRKVDVGYTHSDNQALGFRDGCGGKWS